jgi:RNA-dependent RNA polymerase
VYRNAGFILLSPCPVLLSITNVCPLILPQNFFVQVYISVCILKYLEVNHLLLQDVVEFFATHMLNDNLGKISNAHVVKADLSPEGALDEGCLALAELAAKAVDYPKTGIPAMMPFQLRPREYPHFMEKDESITYESSKIIGSLYRSIQGILRIGPETKEQEEASIDCQIPDPVYDPDFEVAGFEAHLKNAWAMKQAYDRQVHAIMAQFNIANEAEVVTGYVMVGAGKTSRRQGDLKERVKCSYQALTKEYSILLNPQAQNWSWSRAESIATDFCLISLEDSKQDESDKDVLAQVSACYHVTYHHDWYTKEENCRLGQRPFLSFPWVAVDLLIAIKHRRRSRV